jgi:PAS domain S-box-containing protein/putative nucleotidyltransferase with HDIG domain
VFVSLIYNAALLLVMVLVYDLLARHLRVRPLTFKLLTGLVLGGIAIAVMASALRMDDGVIFDTRSVVLSMGSLFYGTIPGLVAAAIAGLYRAAQGGGGAVMGVSVIAASVAIGIIWRKWRHIADRDPGILELYVFGLTVHAVMLLLTTTLPDPVATLRDIALPVIIVYPLASVLVGLLMIESRRRRRSDAALQESQQRFEAFAEHVPGRLWIRDADLRYLYVNPRLAAEFGVPEAELVGKRPEELWDEVTSSQAVELCRQALAEGSVDFVQQWPLEDGAPYLKSHVFSIPGADGRAMIGGLVFDVTMERSAEQELIRHAEQLRRTLEGAVLAISHLVESRDPYTAGHQRRVAELACAIGRQLGLSEDELEGLRLSALVHDIGKVSVPAEILARPGRIQENEVLLIREHPQVGHDILSRIDFERPVAGIVLQHHERLDGSGYPAGLAGSEILPEARVLAVADVFEAMVSHRPYRPALLEEEALAELTAGAGVRYDPDVVAACVRLVGDGFKLPAAGD